MRVCFNSSPNIRLYSNTGNIADNKLSFKNMQLSQDTFVKAKKDPVDLILHGSEKFGVSDYSSLSAKEKTLIRKQIINSGFFADDKYIVDENVELAIDLKEMLDSKYGEDNYVFVSIGTSPSLIAKAFEYMGVETKYLPISNLGKSNFGCIPDKYDEVLELQGMSRQDIKNSSKHYLFYDYVNTGASLKKVKEYMLRPYSEELKSSNNYNAGFLVSNNDCIYRMHFLDFANDMIEFSNNPDYIMDYISRYCTCSGSDNYTSVAHLPFYAVEDTNLIPQNLTVYENKYTRYYNFLVMDILYHMGLLKEYPGNHNSL